MNIYCDESGYTGRELLDEVQPYFVYSAVNFTTEELDDIKQYIYSNYKIQNDEIKGKLLVNNTLGQRAIKHVFEKYSKNVRIVYHDKKYVLASKIVEYGIEPYLRSNHIFYESKLNDFIATGLYLLFITKHDTAEKLFNDFLLILRGKITKNENLFETYSSENPLVEWLLDIITTKPSIVWEEIQTGNDVDRWILDLTMTSLLGLLTEWSKHGDELTVVCDNSKVFVNNPQLDIIERFGKIGPTNVLGTTLGYKLNGKITNADSKENFGVQIADLFSSTVFYCLNNENSAFSKFIMKIVGKDCICKPNSFCVVPKISNIEDEFKVNRDFYLTQMAIIQMDVKKRFK